jgi:hypothetical protein
MKSYIFSEHERQLLKGFVRGEVSRSNPTIMQVKSRMKTFALLRQDIELYSILARMFTESEPARPA